MKVSAPYKDYAANSVFETHVVECKSLQDLTYANQMGVQFYKFVTEKVGVFEAEAIATVIVTFLKYLKKMADTFKEPFIFKKGREE